MLTFVLRSVLVCIYIVAISSLWGRLRPRSAAQIANIDYDILNAEYQRFQYINQSIDKATTFTTVLEKEKAKHAVKAFAITHIEHFQNVSNDFIINQFVNASKEAVISQSYKKIIIKT